MNEQVCTTSKSQVEVIIKTAMSLQPCLPLPSSRSRKRRRDRRHGNDIDITDSNDNNDYYGDMNNTAGSTVTMMSGKQRIEDLGAMSAMEFIGRVHEESRRLGDVFVAPAAGGDNDASSENGGDENNGRHAEKQEDAKDEEEEEEEGEIAEPAHGATASSSLTTAGTTGNSCASDSTTKQPLPSNNVGISGSLAYLLSDHTHLPRPPSAAHLPASACASSSASSPSSWIDATLDDFSKLRLYIDACVEGQIGNKKQPGNGVSSGSRMPVPPMRAREGWHVFCLGRDEAQGYYQDDDEEEEEDTNLVDDKSNGRKVEPWRDSIPPAGHLPSTALLCQMDQVMVRRVLAHHVSYVCDGVDGGGEEVGTYKHTTYAMTTNRARWLYGLLARLAKPLHRDDAAMLRKLLRECCIRRARIRVAVDETTARGGGSQTVVSLLNTLIAIVGIYFEQGTTDELFSLALFFRAAALYL